MAPHSKRPTSYGLNVIIKKAELFDHVLQVTFIIDAKSNIIQTHPKSCGVSFDSASNDHTTVLKIDNAVSRTRVFTLWIYMLLKRYALVGHLAHL